MHHHGVMLVAREIDFGPARLLLSDLLLPPGPPPAFIHVIMSLLDVLYASGGFCRPFSIWSRKAVSEVEKPSSLMVDSVPSSMDGVYFKSPSGPSCGGATHHRPSCGGRSFWIDLHGQ